MNNELLIDFLGKFKNNMISVKLKNSVDPEYDLFSIEKYDDYGNMIVKSYNANGEWHSFIPYDSIFKMSETKINYEEYKRRIDARENNV